MTPYRSPSSRLLQAKVRRARKTLELFYRDHVNDRRLKATACQRAEAT